MATVDAFKTFGLSLRSSVLHVSRRDLVSKFQPFSKSAALPVLRPSCIERSLKTAGESTFVRSTAHIQTAPHKTLHLFLAGFCGHVFDDNSRSEVSGLSFVAAQRSDCTRIGRLDSNNRRKGDCGLDNAPQHTPKAQTNRQEHPNSSSSLRESEQSSTTWNCQRCVLDFFLQILDGLQPGFRLGLEFQDVLHVVFLTSLSASAPRFTNTDSPDTSIGISTSCCSRKCGITRTFSHDWRPGLLKPRFRIWLASVNLQDVRGPQDHALFSVQSSPDTHRCEVLLLSP